jgi:hypothetical protein
VDSVEIFADNDTDFLREGDIVGDDFHDLREEFVPEDLGIASEERDIDLVMDIADSIMVILLIGFQLNALLVSQLRGTVSLEHVENLRIFSDSGGAVEDKVGQFSQSGGELAEPVGELGVEIVPFHGENVVFIMRFVEFHGR